MINFGRRYLLSRFVLRWSRRLQSIAFDTLHGKTMLFQHAERTTGACFPPLDVEISAGFATWMTKSRAGEKAYAGVGMLLKVVLRYLAGLSTGIQEADSPHFGLCHITIGWVMWQRPKNAVSDAGRERLPCCSDEQTRGRLLSGRSAAPLASSTPEAVIGSPQGSIKRINAVPSKQHFWSG